MFYYARSDTHFLLYIYDNMRNELIEKSKKDDPEDNRLETVLHKSKETSLLRYERQIYEAESGKGPGGWYQLLVKTPALFTNEQFAVFRAVHGWRDRIARTDDESTNFVMPNHVIFSLAKLMPTDMVSLLSAAHPISHGVKSRSGELLDIIKKAMIAGQNGPSMMEVLRPDTVGAVAKASLPSKAPNANKPPSAIEDSLDSGSDAEVRSTNSRFWGSAFGSSIWDATPQRTSQSTMRLAIPLPPLSSSVFASPRATAINSARLEAAELEKETQRRTMRDQEEQAQRENEAFILKSGKKRKASPEPTSGEYDISLDPEAEAASAAKVARKAQRKVEKKAEKAARKRAQGQDVGMLDVDKDKEEEEEAFDYSKAEPVLNGKKDGQQGGRGKKQKPFDPYAKSTDTSQGMRRVQTERPGKSLTFRS